MGLCGVSSSSSAVAIASADPAPVKPRRKYRLSDSERQRRADAIRPYSLKGLAAAHSRPPEERSRTAAAGGKAMFANYRAMKSVLSIESPESIRARRKELEGKRDALLDHLLACAAGDADPQADLAIIKAALAELRPEIGLLIDREERAKAAGPSIPTAPRAAIGPAATVQPAPASFPAHISPGNPPSDILPADILPAIASD
jgi:hypothetical protein